MNKVFRSRHFRGLVNGAILLVCVHIAGTLGYHWIGRPTANWVDSFYMTFITVATIGYSEVIDLAAHPYGRLFTVAVAIVGIMTMSYLFSTFVALLLEADLNTAFRKRHMHRQISDLRGHYIVCGIGRVGTNVTHELLKTRRPYVIVEHDQAALDACLEREPNTVYVHDDAASDEALQNAGLSYAAGVFAVTGDDSHNLMIAMSVKLMNPRCRVVARLHDIRNADKARRAGADEIVSPDFTGGMRIASAMVRPHVVNFMDQMLRSDDLLRVEELVLPAGFAPRPLVQVLPRSRDYVVMATHERGRWVFNPADDHLLQPGACIVLMTNPGIREKLELELNPA